ncbi:MAG: hypothetical protein K9J76_10780 [Polaromonas sp.]|nr:hypothetical protein [Polaromonas sp.]
MPIPPTQDSAPLQRAQALFEQEGLPFVQLPMALSSALAEHSPLIYATRPLVDTPYDLSAYLEDLASTPDAPDYAVVGFDGYGYNSWAVHHYALQSALALFIQLPWGGAFADADADRAEINSTFHWAEGLLLQVAQLQQQGLIPAGWRLLVIVSSFARSGWAWLGPAGSADANPPLQTEGKLRADVDRSLAEMASGQTVLGTHLLKEAP